MTDNDFITQLIEELAELFPLRDDIIVVARESGLSPQHIKMDGRGATIWSEVLEEAKKQAKLLELVIVALRHFPNRQILIQAKVRLEQPAPRYCQVNF